MVLIFTLFSLMARPKYPKFWYVQKFNSECLVLSPNNSFKIRATLPMFDIVRYLEAVVERCSVKKVFVEAS